VASPACCPVFLLIQDNGEAEEADLDHEWPSVLLVDPVLLEAQGLCLEVQRGLGVFDEKHGSGVKILHQHLLDGSRRRPTPAVSRLLHLSILISVIALPGEVRRPEMYNPEASVSGWAGLATTEARTGRLLSSSETGADCSSLWRQRR
jgi:hypothetical protein